MDFAVSSYGNLWPCRTPHGTDNGNDVAAPHLRCRGKRPSSGQPIQPMAGRATLSPSAPNLRCRLS